MQNSFIMIYLPTLKGTCKHLEKYGSQEQCSMSNIKCLSLEYKCEMLNWRQECRIQSAKVSENRRRISCKLQLWRIRESDARDEQIKYLCDFCLPCHQFLPIVYNFVDFLCFFLRPFVCVHCAIFVISIKCC